MHLLQGELNIPNINLRIIKFDFKLLFNLFFLRISNINSSLY